MLTLMVLFLLRSSSYSQVLVPQISKPYTPIIAECVHDTVGDSEAKFLWTFSEDVHHKPTPEHNKVYVWAPPGTHTVDVRVDVKTWRTIKNFVPGENWPEDTADYKIEDIRVITESSTDFYSGSFQVEGKEPGPGPEPGPTPTPSDAPFPAPGLAVMVVKESQDPLSREHSIVYLSNEVRNYCLNNCVELEDGDPAIRFYDDDHTQESLRAVPDVMKAAYEVALRDSNGARPWLVVSNGETGVSQPFPNTVAEMMAILKEHTP